MHSSLLRHNFRLCLNFRLRLWFAARVLPFQIRQNPLKDVLALADPVKPGRYQGLSSSYIARSVLRVTRHPWLMRDRRCLRQGVLGYRFLTEAGFKPELHFAVNASSLHADQKTSAHCWVCIDGVPVLNDGIKDMVTVLIHPVTETKTIP